MFYGIVSFEQSNTCIALHNLLYHPNCMCFIKNEHLQLQYVVGFFCKIYDLSAYTMYKL